MKYLPTYKHLKHGTHLQKANKLMNTCIQDCVPSALSSTKTFKVEENRRSANYHPSIWGDFFLAFSSDDSESDNRDEAELHCLKEKVKNMLDETPDKSAEKLDLIDTIQRLGVAYHFETEIEACLRNIYDSYSEFLDKDHKDANYLHVVSLRFRLLRQQGYHVSSDVFNKFKDQEGKFDESLTCNNLKGILSLYEAAHYRVHGESILDEALTFTSSHLESLLSTLSDLHAAEVRQALELPIRKALTRVAARLYFPTYESDESHNPILLKFSKLDFNLLQKLHQKELSGITKWWKGLDCPKNFPFARDRVVECYFWALGAYFEPKYCIARMFLAKVFAMTTIIDDIYDVYGTLDELTLLTDAIKQWQISAANQLPSYMRHCYQALLDVYLEMEELAKQGETRVFGVSYARAAMKQAVGAYYEEATWFYNDYFPTVEEYLKVAVITITFIMLGTNSFVGMGEIATKEVFDWVSNDPLLVRAASIIGRLMNDLAGHEAEQERGDAASAVECYMKHNNASKQEAYVELERMITNAWKDINNECLEPTAVPRPLLERVVNLAKATHVVYTNEDHLAKVYRKEDNYSIANGKVKDLITLLLVDPMKI